MAETIRGLFYKLLNPPTNDNLKGPEWGAQHVAEPPKKTTSRRSSALRAMDDAAKRGNEIKNGVNR